MKKALKITGIIVLFILLAMILTPFIFKGKLVQMAKDEINKNVNAKVDFTGASLSLFKSFPDFNLSLKGLQIIGKEKFAEDTLVLMDALSIDIDILDVFQGAPYEIKKIILNKPIIKLLTLENGSINYDITLPSEPEIVDTLDESTNEVFTLKIKDILVKKGKLLYEDRELDFIMLIDEIDGNLSGDFSADLADMEMELSTNDLTMSYEGFEFLSKVKTNFNSFLKADMNTSTYTLKNTQAILNNLVVDFEGSFLLGEEDYAMDFNFKSKDGDFKSLLSLIPAIYSRQFEQVKTSGAFSLIGSVSGIYSETSMPGFSIDLNVDNGSFQYPALPKSADNIFVSLKVNNETGILDATNINLNRFQMAVADNPISATLKLKTPISNPDFKTSLKGKLDLNSLSDVIPLEQDESLKGNLNFDLSLDAKMSDIDSKHYDQILANGTLTAQEISYKSAMFDLPIAINKANLNFSSASIDLSQIELSVGKSDFSGSGKVNDFLPYYLGNGILKGSLNLKSSLIDMNELLSGMIKDENSEVKNDTTKLSVILPERVDFNFTAEAEKLLYEKYELSNITSIVSFKDQSISFNPLKAELLGGTMKMTGDFDGSDSQSHAFEFDFNLLNFDIPQSYKTIGLFQKAAPIAEKTKGNFSTGFRLKGAMDNDLNLTFETLLGGGKLQTSQISIASVKTMEQLATLLGNEKYGRLITDGLNFSFEILNGKVYQKPLKIKYADSDVTIGGNIGFDQKIDYDLTFQIPYQTLGNNVQTGINKLVTAGANLGIPINPGTSVQVKAKISGLVKDPKVTLDYKDFLNSSKSNIESKFNQELDKQKDELKQKANIEIDKLLVEAKKQGDALIAQSQLAADKVREEAQKAAELAKNEADKQADRLVEDAGKKGMLASLAAKEAAKKIRLDGDKTSNKIILEADRKANELIDKARNQADELIRLAEEIAAKI